MTRKEELLKLLRARLEIVEQKILSYPIWANESAYTELIAEARKTAEAIRILENDFDKQ